MYMTNAELRRARKIVDGLCELYDNNPEAGALIAVGEIIGRSEERERIRKNL